MGKSGPRHLAGGAALLALALAGPALPCSGPPLLGAQVRGTDLDLTWVGMLDPGDTWSVYSGLLSDLHGGVFSHVLVQGGLAAAAYTDSRMPPTNDGYYYLVRCEGLGGNGEWSNMAFKLVRDLATVEDAAREQFLNRYYLASPSLPGWEDTANSAAPERNKCVRDIDGPTTPDGILNADDLICSWWTSRAPCCRHGIVVSTYPAEPLGYVLRPHRGALYEDSPFGPGWVFAGPWTEPLPANLGFIVEVAQGSALPASNLAVIGGAHDPSQPCQTIEFLSTPALHVLNIPYHAVYRTADEILCGLPRLRDPAGWVDALNNITGAPGADGMPDTCPNGIFDAANPARPYRMQLTIFDNVDDGSGPAPDARDTDNTFVVRLAQINPFGKLLFQQDDFDVGPGDAVQVTIEAAHRPTQFCPRVRCTLPEAPCP